MSTTRSRMSLWAAVLLLLGGLLSQASAYQVLISDSDPVRQVCSGMYGRGKQDAFIEVLFTPSSRGQLALVIFEWSDAKYLGIDKSGDSTAENTWSSERVYICTLTAQQDGLCKEADSGKFITTPAELPSGTSIFTQAVRFDSVSTSGPFRYDVAKTGYYCVGTVPLTLQENGSNTSFTGVVDYENVFGGHLSAAEFPKVYFYGALTLAYLLVAVVWAVLSFQNRRELLPIQHYISATVVFLVFEMFMVYTYYNYVNSIGHPGVANVLLLLVALLNAARNSLSFFLLLITAMGYGVVRPSLGPVMMKARLLAIVHFVFGVLYSLGTVAIPLESAGVFIFFFIFPLSFSLTAFLMWIMWSLNSTIADLAARRQSFKKGMFTKLYRILVCAVTVIAAFFIISTVSFSSRLDEDFGPKTWKTRWILLDGWLGALYFLVFTSIAFLWRPTANNRRLALSDELPTEDLTGEDYEVDDGLTGDEADDKEAIPLRRSQIAHDSVVFDVGDDDDSSEGEERDSDEEADVGVAHGSAGRRGENRPLRLPTSEDDESGPPPSYRAKRSD